MLGKFKPRRGLTNQPTPTQSPLEISVSDRRPRAISSLVVNRNVETRGTGKIIFFPVKETLTDNQDAMFFYFFFYFFFFMLGLRLRRLTS